MATQVARQLAEPLPGDRSKVDLKAYRKLDRRWQDWETVVSGCRRVATLVLDELAAEEET